MAREAWTDARLDDLNHKVDTGFDEMRTEFRALRGEMRAEIGSVRGELGSVREEIAALNRTIHQFTFAIVGALLLGFLGTIAAILTLV